MNRCLPSCLPAAAMLAAALLAAPPAMAQVALPPVCGALPNAYGPFDYRTSRDKLVIVETHHLTPQVELLVRGQSGSLGGDFDYTLRASPNHHRALLALMRYADRLGTDQAKGATYTFECYFRRAVAFAPDDPTVRMLYATYLNNRNRKPEALAHLKVAEQVGADSGFTQYNIGMVYVDLGEMDLALERAHVAQQLGFGRPELKARLQAAGRWKDPPAAPAADAASAPASSPG